MILQLKEILKEKKISQKDLAAKTGLTTVTINNIVLNGNPTIETLEKIANALNLNIVDLFTPVEKNKNVPIFIKDKNGDDKIIGYLEPDRVGFVFK